MAAIAGLLWPTASFALSTLAVVGIAFAALHLFVVAPRRRARRSGLLREPAQAQRQRLEYVDHRRVAGALGLVLALLFWILLYPAGQGGWMVAIYAAAGAIALGWFAQEVLRFWPERAGLRRTIAGQARTAASLNVLMRRQYWVFHDVHVNGDRIPHLVIGPRGVFCVESLYRRNLGPRGWAGRRPAPAAEVGFDGAALHFPRWDEREVLAAVDARARRFGRWLAEEAGEPGENLPTHAGVALPGWRVTATHWEGVIAFNPTTPNMLVEGAPRGRRIDTTTAGQLVKALRRAHEAAPDPRAGGRLSPWESGVDGVSFARRGA